MEKRSNLFEIPLYNNKNEVIEIDFDSHIPDAKEIMDILVQERAPLYLWIKLALEYYKRGRDSDFATLLEMSGTDAYVNYPDYARDQMRALDLLAAYFVQKGTKERSKDERAEILAKSTVLYTTSDKVNMYDKVLEYLITEYKYHLLGRAYLCSQDWEKIDQADAQFNFVLNQTPNSTAALLGKAAIAFKKKDYKNALLYYKKTLKTNPNCPAEVRLAMGNCFVKLGHLAKARLAFQRALELNPNCVGALSGLAILEMKDGTAESIKSAVHRLTRAYSIDKEDPTVLNQLANHFFFKRVLLLVVVQCRIGVFDRQYSHQLALYAFHKTENEALRAESCFQLGRGEYEQAFQYYYQANQFQSPASHLPLYGLGQMYIQRSDNDKENAIQCFETVYARHPESQETCRILASLYASSNNMERKAKARTMFAKLIEHNDDDVDTWVEYAMILADCRGYEIQALKAFDKAMKLYLEKPDIEIPAEFYNNVGAMHFRAAKYTEAASYFEKALQKVSSIPTDHPLYNSLWVTCSYNLARVKELLYELEEAEKMYKDILRRHPAYVHCYLRLGCMSRDRGQIYDASVWFKEALQFNPDDPDAWTLIGNLHLGKQEWGPAQKKFERILKQPSTAHDPYSLVALGNVWFLSLQSYNHEKEKQRKYEDRALSLYKQALRVHPENILAANGVGCVLAHRGYFQEAKEVFSRVCEATGDFVDALLNIAHIYVELRNYVAAIQTYECCLKKFAIHGRLDIWQCLAVAYYRANRLPQSKRILLSARIFAPYDAMTLYSLSFVLKRHAVHVMKDLKSGLKQVLDAVKDLEVAERQFLFLAKFTDVSSSVRRGAAIEGQKCTDILSQAQHHVERAQRKEEAENELRRNLEEERRLLLEKQQEEQRLKEEERKRLLEEQEIRRRDFIERTKKLLIMPTFEEEKPKRAPKGRKRKDEEFVNDDSDLGDWEPGRQSLPKKRKPKALPKERRGRQNEKRRLRTATTDSEAEASTANVSKPKNRREALSDLNAKQKAKIKSREILSSTSSSGDSAKDAMERPSTYLGTPEQSDVSQSNIVVKKEDFEAQGDDVDVDDVIREVFDEPETAEIKTEIKPPSRKRYAFESEESDSGSEIRRIPRDRFILESDDSDDEDPQEEYISISSELVNNNNVGALNFDQTTSNIHSNAGSRQTHQWKFVEKRSSMEKT
ncbi:RNA polymerase-associated protein CTR9 -like protein [Trichinella spiralis]|uniref:RNA polymerase-associated protein CTR9-like protein n=1 Tax=Trichinella spiralis TaxID=6334 RepID=A0A0V1BUT2_TRISP|nr:RNA polymerase-associated protein CTR9 -like protein [Trichinella spiralis]